MKIRYMVPILCFCISLALPALAAPRTVLYELFSEDDCLWCGQVADSMLDFYNSHSREQIAIIQMNTDHIHGAQDRMDDYDLSGKPKVVCDGIANLEPEPADLATMNASFNNRTGVSSNLTMEVFKESDTQYRIHVDAVNAVSGVLVAVAYEDTTHEEHHYPCFGRQFLTNYYGESISLAAGESRDIYKTVTLQSGWNPAQMGVVAWVQSSSKFRPSEVYQSADSKAPHTNPTPTPPLCTPTPTPPSGFTPTPTPTFSDTDLIQTLDLSETTFYPGDQFILDVVTNNPGTDTRHVDMFVALNVGDQWFFNPAWNQIPAPVQRSYAPGSNRENILTFNWPTGAGSFSPLFFYLASLDHGTSHLSGPYDFVEFGYAE